MSTKLDSIMELLKMSEIQARIMSPAFVYIENFVKNDEDVEECVEAVKSMMSLMISKTGLDEEHKDSMIKANEISVKTILTIVAKKRSQSNETSDHSGQTVMEFLKELKEN